MPRRYPQLSATDYDGRFVAIPLEIAPKLLPHEHFTSPSQKRVNEIAAEAKRRTEVLREHVSPLKNFAISLTNIPPQADTGPTPRDSTLRDSVDMDLEHTHLDGSSNAEISERATASSSDTDFHAETFTRSRVRWTEEEDEVVMSAVLIKEPVSALFERLVHRCRSAVMQRFHMIKERHERDMDASDGLL